MNLRTHTFPLVAFPNDNAWAIFRDFETLGMVYVQSLTASASVQVASGIDFDPSGLGTPIVLTFDQAGVTKSVPLPARLQVHMTYNTLAVGLLTVGNTVTMAGGVSGTIVTSTALTAAVGSIDVDVTAGTFAAGALTDTTTGATATVLAVTTNVVIGSAIKRATRVLPLSGQVSVTYTGPSEFVTFMSAPTAPNFSL